MCIKNTLEKYGAPAKALHWGVGILIIGLLAVGLIMTDMTDSPDKLQLYGLHKATGIVVLSLVLVRIVWRQINVVPTLPANMKALEKKAAHFGHLALYALMLAMPISGWLMSSAAGYPVSVYGLFTLPNLVAPDKGLRELFGDAHEIMANGLMILLAVHVLAALKHHFIEKDNTLRRMLPW